MLRPSSVSLSGDGWKLSSAGPHRRVEVSAIVPNDISDDLERAGVLPDLWYGLNSQHEAAWVMNQSWTLTRAFATPASGTTAAWLQFDGVDYNCSVSLNGRPLADHIGAFEPFEVDVLGGLHREAGAINTLQVTLHAPPSWLAAQLYPPANASSPIPPGYPLHNEGVDHCKWNEQLLRWRPRLAFWDFATKHWSIGIWRNVTLRHVRGAARLHPQLELASQPTPPYAAASLQATVRWRSISPVAATAVAPELRLRLSARCVTNASAPVARTFVTIARPKGAAKTDGEWTSVSIQLRVGGLQLWWPNGYGAQHRYEVRAELLQCASAHTNEAKAGCVLVDEVAEPSFGFRRLEELDNPTTSASWLYGQFGVPCTGPGCTEPPWLLNSSDYNAMHDPRIPSKRRWLLAINGQKIFARGGNWVPLDQMFGRGVRDQPRLRATLTMARDAGYTFLRVWGGGLIEDQSFYRLCDELGLMIEQEMPMAGCGYMPPYRAADVAAWREQVPIMVDQVKSHPSVVRYSMGNEYYRNATECPIMAAYQQAATLADPSRIPREADPVCVGQRHGPYTFAATGIGRHGPDIGDYDVYGRGCPIQLGSECRAPFAVVGGPADPFEWTEFGASALSSAQTLRTIIPPDKLFPTGTAGAGSAEWGWHKGDGNPYISWQATRLYTSTFLPNGLAFVDLDEEVRASQWLQAEGYRFAYQAARRRKWHRSAMAAWTLNEPWPNAAHGSVLDYRGQPKMAYAWVRGALQMADVALEYYDVFAIADGRTPLGSPGRFAVWVDSEFAHPLRVGSVTLELLYANGTEAGPTEQFTLQNNELPPSQAVRLGDVGFIPSASAVGEVLLVRLSLNRHDVTKEPPLAQHTYAFALAPTGTNSTNIDAPLLPLLRPSLIATLKVSASRAGSGDAPVDILVAASGAAAWYVQLTLRTSHNGSSLPFVSISRNHLLVREGETVSATAVRLVPPPSAMAVLACAEAWNVRGRVCAPVAVL